MEKYLAPEPLSDGGNLPEQWKTFKKHFEQFLVATEKNGMADTVKIAILLRMIGVRGNDIYENFKFEAAESKDCYQTVMTKYDDFCKPRVNLLVTRHKLFTQKQGHRTIDEFVTQLRKLARDCNFGPLYDDMVLHALMLGLNEERTRRRLFEQADGTLTLEKALQRCRAAEDAATDMQALKETAQQETVQAVETKTRWKKSNYDKREARPNKASQYKCSKCGYMHEKQKCPAFGKKCRKCHKANHYEKMCRSSKTVHLVNDANDSDESVLKVKVDKQDRKLVAKIQVSPSGVERQTELSFQLDTAATCNILSYVDYRKLEKPTMGESTATLTMYDGTEVKPMGTCKLNLHASKEHSFLFQITPTKNMSLLSLDTCIELGLLSINENVHMLDNTPEITDLNETIEQYSDVFKGLGCLPGEYDIELDPNVRPVQNRPRKIPLSMKADVKTKLETLEKLDVIEKVEEPSQWISNMQPVRKPNGTIRICVDPSDLNKAIRRNHFQMPSIDDVLPQLTNAKIFSLCDAKDGFLQIKLTERSSQLTTFWTPYGRYKWKRMPFGIKSSPEEFQRRLTNALENLTGVTVVADDILIYGCGDTQAEARRDHDRNLIELLERARNINLKLNKAKCRFNMTELQYIGHVLTPQGVKPDPEKVNVIKSMKQPKDAEEVRRFLGYTNYLAKFIPNLSSVAEPLRKLIHKDADFLWETEQQTALDKIKELTTSEQLLGYFDPKKSVVLQTDASTVGLGAVLMQNDKPIAYASRSLTKSERNYAPIELECLAIVFATRKYDQYIFGHSDVTVHTDHKPLETIWLKSLLHAPKRLQSMLLTLQRYTLKIQYRPGREQLVADMLSRLRNSTTQPDELPREQVFQMKVTEELLESFRKSDASEDKRVTDIRYQEIKTATAHDDDLMELARVIMTGWSDERQNSPIQTRPYWTFRDELTVHDGIIYKGSQIIIPKALRRELLNRLHVSHSGNAAMMRRAQDAIFWPGLRADIKEVAERCDKCQRDAPSQQKETLRQHFIPDKPWSKVGVDIFTYNRVNYLVLVDYYSDFIEFEELTETTATSVIKACKQQFARHGIPEVVQSDNGPQFTSAEFRRFSEAWKFTVTSSSPYHSKSNGKAESAVKIAKRLLKRAEDPYLGLLEFRNTPTTEMTTSPVQRLMNRTTRSVIPQVRQDFNPTTTAAVRAEKQRRRLKIQHQYNKHARDLSQIQLGAPVLIKDMVDANRRWKQGRVVDQLNERSYTVENDGNLIRRNRVLLKPLYEQQPDDIRIEPPSNETSVATTDQRTPETLQSPNTDNTTKASDEPVKTRTETTSQSYRTRSGREVVKPTRFRE